jgi:hypothetical protein
MAGAGSIEEVRIMATDMRSGQLFACLLLFLNGSLSPLDSYNQILDVRDIVNIFDAHLCTCRKFLLQYDGI